MLWSQRDSETSPLKIEEIRAVAGRLALKPFEARYRIAIFRDFDSAQPRAQDALLKTLEEPAPHAILILLARSLEAILPTIISRSQVIHLRPLSIETIHNALVTHFGADEAQASLLAHISSGRMGWALQALRQPEMLGQRAEAFDLLETIVAENRVGRFARAETLARDKAGLIALLEWWLTYWRDLLLLTEDARREPTNIDRRDALRALAKRFSPDDAARALAATRNTLEVVTMTNANVRLALEVLLLDYPGLA
jgi:DNA polymerase-3 subunit delta'